MAWNLPDGCSDYDIDVAAGGYDLDRDEEPEESPIEQPADMPEGDAAVLVSESEECPF